MTSGTLTMRDWRKIADEPRLNWRFRPGYVESIARRVNITTFEAQEAMRHVTARIWVDLHHGQPCKGRTCTHIPPCER